jgi:nucleotide-binding universal stress UspA family protein
MLRALIPVDGSENAERAVRHAIGLIRGREPMAILLLNVQEPVDAIEVTSHMPAEEIRAWQITHGSEEMESARALLDAAGIVYEHRVVLGKVAETIARVAREERCDKIIMGTRGMGAIQSLLLGSIATKVIHLADVPVTLVK